MSSLGVDCSKFLYQLWHCSFGYNIFFFQYEWPWWLSTNEELSVDKISSKCASPDFIQSRLLMNLKLTSTWNLTFLKIVSILLLFIYNYLQYLSTHCYITYTQQAYTRISMSCFRLYSVNFFPITHRIGGILVTISNFAFI